MASRFWGGASSSEDESEHSSGEEDVKVPSRFAKGGAAEPESSDDEEEVEQVKRVVKSARDKRFEELAAILSRVKNHLKINDWNSVVEEYEKLNKQLDKAKQIVAKEGVPRVFIKSLVVLEDAVKRTQDNKSSIKMNGPNTKSFNAMRQKIKKGNKNYEKQIEEYRKNPDADEDEDREEKEESSESEPEPEPESESSEEEKSNENSEDEDSDEEFQEEQASRSKWFTTKSAKSEAKEDKDIRRAPKVQKEGSSKKPKAEREEANKPVEMNEEQVKAKLKEILAERGKKKTDASKQSTRFAELLPFAKTPELEVEILIHLISSQFDMNRSVATALPVAAWKNALENVKKVLTILEANPNVVLQEHDVIAPSSASNNNDAEAPGAGEDADEQKQVSGNLMAFIERLDDEYIKSLQNIDPHTKDYIQRLQDEVPFLQVSEQTQSYYEKHGKFTQAARIAERQIEHLYFRQDNKEKRSEVEPQMARLTEVVYAHGDDRLKIRTLLCNIYFAALLDKFYEARDMMLMSHLQDSISHTDILTQILFNRTMVQLGLCAFRLGLIKQAHSCLSEICAGGRVKELLAQGTNTRFHDRNPEQEKEERRRQLPYHMHINQDVLDAVHYICAMLLEVPNMAAHAFDVKKKLISRPFRRLLEAFEKSVFNGPPENTRDVIVHAAKALEAGNWKLCQELVFGLPIWALLPTADKLKEMLSQKIKEEGLRTYLFAFNTLYDSISLEHLVQVFELDKNEMHSIVSKMMINEELHASWDQPTGSIIMHQVEPTRLQYLAMQLAEKAAVFVENNEKLLDAKTGSYGYNKSDQDQKQQKGGQRGGPRQPYNKGQQGNKGGQQQGGQMQGNKGGKGQQGGNKGGNRDNSQQQKNMSNTNKSGGNKQQQQRNKGGQNKGGRRN